MLAQIEIHPYFGSGGGSDRNKLIIAPRTIASNFCLINILSYTCSKDKAVAVFEFNRLSKRALYFFRKQSTLNFFTIPPLKVVLNHWDEPQRFFESRIYLLSRKHSLKVQLNIPLSSVAEAICSSDS